MLIRLVAAGAAVLAGPLAARLAVALAVGANSGTRTCSPSWSLWARLRLTRLARGVVPPAAARASCTMLPGGSR